MRLYLNDIINYDLQGKSGIKTCPMCKFYDDPSPSIAHFTICSYHEGWVEAFRNLDEEFDLFHLRMNGDYD